MPPVKLRDIRIDSSYHEGQVTASNQEGKQLVEFEIWLILDPPRS